MYATLATVALFLVTHVTLASYVLGRFVVIQVSNSDLGKLPLYCCPCWALRGGYSSLGMRSKGQVPKHSVMEYRVK